MEKQIWTIGHSNKPFEEFVGLLKVNKINVLADVRRYPGSAKYPQFNQEFLQQELKNSNLTYCHYPDLGGRRKAHKDSKNTAWRNEAFKGYADFMETQQFQEALTNLISVSHGNRIAMMCSEVLWWRCHRSLIADALKSTGWTVWHILSETKVQEHPYTSAARLRDGKLSYGPDQLKLF